MNKILYPPLIIVGIIIPIIVYTLINRSDENIVFAGVWSLGQVLGYDDCYDSSTCPHGKPNNWFIF